MNSQPDFRGRLEIFPSIDLRDDKNLRRKQGDYAQQITYELDPCDVARSFADAGARWLHLVDLDGAKAGQIEQIKTITRIIRAAPLKVQVGGGVRERDDIACLLRAGAERVVIGTRAVTDWPWLEELASEKEMAGRVVLALDARDGVVATHGWHESAGVTAVELARRAANLPLGAILYTDVARDGMMGGPNITRTVELAEVASCPVLASGGVGKLAHVLPLVSTPVAGVIVGRSLHEGTLDLAEAIRLGQGRS